MFLKMGKLLNKFKIANLLYAKIVNPLFLTKKKRKKKLETNRRVLEMSKTTLRRQKSESPVSDATPKERALRDALNDVLTSAGIDVVTDVEEGQRVLDEVNGNARMMAKKRALKTASLSEDTERSLTVVSSAQGANILNNLDTLISSLENSATQPKTFIGDVAKALGAIGFVQLGTRRQFRKAAYGDAHCEVEHQGLRRMAHRKGE